MLETLFNYHLLGTSMNSTINIRANLLSAMPSVNDCQLFLQESRKKNSALDQLLQYCEQGFSISESTSPVQLQPVGVSTDIGALIYWLVSNRPACITMEAGFGYGVASAFFAVASKVKRQAAHYSYEAYMDWTQGVGNALLEKLDVSNKVTIVELLAHLGMSNLYQQLGWYSVGIMLFDCPDRFEDTMAQFAVADRMLARDGVLLVRGSHLPQNRAFLSFLETNRDMCVENWSDDLAVVRRIPHAERNTLYFQPFNVPLEGYEEPVTGNIVQTIAPDDRPLQFANEISHQQYLRRVMHGYEYPALLPDVFVAHTILDIGAHVGTAARYFSAVYPNARIVCVEPTPESFELLSLNTAHLANVERHQVALTDKPGTLRIWRGQQSSGQNSALPNNENSSDFFDATAVEPSVFCKQYGLEEISILKMDIEGMEMHVLNNLKPLLDRIQILYIEYHSEDLRHQIDDLLRSRFTLFCGSVEEAFRGTVGYVETRLLLSLLAETSAPRYVYPKQ